MSAKNLKVIVTGASGNLGHHIVKTEQFDFLPINRGNWSDLENLKENEIDYVIHSAYDLKKDLNVVPDQNLESNILSTGTILRICREKKIKNFVFISSCAVYGDSSNSAEDKPTTPVNMNGHIKQFNEELVKSFCTNNNINYIILRVFNSYGGNDNFSIISKIIKAARTGSPFTLFNEGIAERDFVHIEDVANVVCQLINKDLKNEIINIGSGETTRIIDLVKALEAKIGNLNISKVTRPNEAIYSRANTKKLKQILNYKFRPINEFIDRLE